MPVDSQISGFPLEIADTLCFGVADAGPLFLIDLGPQHSAAQRFHAHPGIRADRLARGIHRLILTEMIEHHLNRTLTLLDWLMLGHNRHPSHRRKRHQTRDCSGIAERCLIPGRAAKNAAKNALRSAPECASSAISGNPMPAAVSSRKSS